MCKAPTRQIWYPLTINAVSMMTKAPARSVWYPMSENVIRPMNREGGKFGPDVRRAYLKGKLIPKAHNGWDLLAKPGTAVMAASAGEVTQVLNGIGGYGTLIQLKFYYEGTPYWALYAHLEAVSVKRGDTVSIGQELGKTGATGNASKTPPHLHFEIATSPSLRRGRKNQIDPAELYGPEMNDWPGGSIKAIENYDTEKAPDYLIDSYEFDAAEEKSRTA